MSITGLDVFDRTVQKTNSWLKSLMDELNWEDRHKAYGALRVTLQALRDRLTIEEVAQFGAQLPMLIRGFYYEGWDPTGKPEKLRHREEFLEPIAEYFVQAGEPVHPEPVARAVFSMLAQRISDGEIEDVKHILPKELRSLWP